MTPYSNRKSKDANTALPQSAKRSFRVSIVVRCLVSVADLTRLLRCKTEAHAHTELLIFLFCLSPRLRELASVCLRQWETKKWDIKQVKENVGALEELKKKTEKNNKRLLNVSGMKNHIKLDMQQRGGWTADTHSAREHLPLSSLVSNGKAL